MSNFKSRVNEFYRWFKENELKIRNFMDEGKSKEAYQLLEPAMRKVLGELYFQVHKDTVRNRYFIELTTLMDDSKKIVCFYFCDELPLSLREKWSFYYYHPAFKGTVDYKGKTYSASNFKMVPSVNKKNKKIDINVVNKNDFRGMSDQDKFMITYMILADYIGEMCVDAYVGGISFGRSSLFKKHDPEKEVALVDMYDYINTTAVAQKWIRPKEIKLIASGFQQTKNKSVGIRSDFQEGFSYCVDVLNEEGTNNTDLSDYIKSLGVGMYSICTTKNLLDEAKSKARKNEVEKRLSSILAKGKSGFMIHSINGKAHDYADFFLYDDLVLADIKKEIIDKFDSSTLIEL